MSRTGRLTMMAALAATTSLALAACGGGSDGDGGEGAGGDGAELELLTPGTLTLCSEVPYPPFEM